MTNRFFLYLLPVFFLLTESCATSHKGISDTTVFGAPDYSDKKNWAALPDKKDFADEVPVSTWKDEQSDAVVDVFFIHPTTYTGKLHHQPLNASLSDQKLNASTDKSTIRYQASIFNGAGKIYAPRYRQAHLSTFYHMHDSPEARQALDLAYSDVKAAFQYYMQNDNHGRPFIIASHSQGSYHAARLIKEMVDNTPLQSKMVVAYMPGWPLTDDQFISIKPCRHPEDTGCFCTWRTFREGYIPADMHYPDKHVTVTNPVTWDCDQPSCRQDAQIGGVLRDFKTLRSNLVYAEVHEDFLWVNKPVFPGSFLFNTKNYHIADYNLFYGDVRKNAQDRVSAYLKSH